MSNCDFIRNQPVSTSDLVCQICEHLYDLEFRTCTCGLKASPIPFKQFLADKLAKAGLK